MLNYKTVPIIISYQNKYLLILHLYTQVLHQILEAAYQYFQKKMKGKKNKGPVPRSVYLYYLTSSVTTAVKQEVIQLLISNVKSF